MPGRSSLFLFPAPARAENSAHQQAEMASAIKPQVLVDESGGELLLSW